MATEQGRRILDVLGAIGPELPIVVLAREVGMPPSRLAPALDELFEAGLVRPGSERRSVTLVPVGEGRFTRPASGRDGRSTPAR